VRPFALLFSVSKTDLAPGAVLKLNATIIDVLRNERYYNTEGIEVEFVNCTSDGANSTISRVPAVNGVALLNVSYPDNGKAHAYVARIVPAGGPKFRRGYQATRSS